MKKILILTLSFLALVASHPLLYSKNLTKEDPFQRLIAELEKGENKESNWGDCIYDAIQADREKFAEIEKKYITKFEKSAVSTKNSNLLYNLGVYYDTKSCFSENSGSDIKNAEKYLMRASDMGNSDAMFYLAHNHFRSSRNPDIDRFIKYAQMYYKTTGEFLGTDHFFALYLKSHGEKDLEYIDKLYKEYLKNNHHSAEISLLYASGKMGKSRVEFGVNALNKIYSRICSHDKLDSNYYSSASILYIMFASGTYLQQDKQKAKRLLDLADDKLALLKSIKYDCIDGVKYLFSLNGYHRIMLLPPQEFLVDDINELIIANGGREHQLISTLTKLFDGENEQIILQKKRTPEYLKKLREVLPLVDSMLADKHTSNYGKRIGKAILLQLKETGRLAEFLRKNPPKETYDFAEYYVLYIEGFCGDENRKKAAEIMLIAKDFSPAERRDFYTSVAEYYDDFLYFNIGEKDHSAEIIKYLHLALDCGVDAPYQQLIYAYIESKGLKNKYENIRNILKLALDDKKISSDSAFGLADEILQGEFMDIDYPKAISLLEYVAKDNRKNNSNASEASLILAMIYALADEPIFNEEKSKCWFEKFTKKINFAGWSLQTAILPYYDNIQTTRERFFPNSKRYWNLPLDYARKMLENGNTEWASQLGYSYDNLSEYKKAEETWLKGLDMGDPYCAYYLAKFYFEGRRGYPVDYRKAIKYGNICLDKIATNNWKREDVSKIILFSYERQKDYSNAFNYAQKMESESPIFKEYTAYCYKLGLGVKKDTQRANGIFAQILNSDMAGKTYIDYDRYGDYSPVLSENKARQAELLKAAARNSKDDYFIYMLAATTIKEANSFEEQKRGVEIYKELKRDFWSSGALIYYCCKHGIGMQADASETELLKRKIKSDSNMNDIMNIAYSFEKGYFEFIKKPDIQEAYSWFKFAAENGNARAKEKIRELEMQMPALSDIDDREKRFNELSEGSANGKESVEYAKMLIEGDGCVKDIAAGLLILRNLAAEGNMEALKEIETLYDSWNKEAARFSAGTTNNTKLLDALNGAAYCELFGIGTQANPDRARELIERAKAHNISLDKNAENNRSLSKNKLLYDSFDTLSLSDIYILRARKLLKEKNSEAKLTEAQNLLYKASCMGNGIADAYLAQIYEDGFGVKKDTQKAGVYFKEALRKSEKSKLLRLYKLYKESDEDGFIRTDKNKLFIIEHKFKKEV